MSLLSLYTILPKLIIPFVNSFGTGFSLVSLWVMFLYWSINSAPGKEIKFEHSSVLVEFILTLLIIYLFISISFFIFV